MASRVLLAAAASLVLAASATAASFAPADHPGPKLGAPALRLSKALSCSPGVRDAQRTPVLLVQGTGASSKANWSWTYEPALDQLAIPWCAIDLPRHATGDIQVNGEYVVYAIRTMYRLAGGRIAIIGHSQGGMVPRWALRFWPGTRRMVGDLIGFAPSNHGTTRLGNCRDGSCSAADWQQLAGTSFYRALNSYAETWRGISYTNIYTHTDEEERPNLDDSGVSSLHSGAGLITNVAIQDICPADVNEHVLIGLIDPVAYALAVDALEHRGPARRARIDPGVCALELQPGIDPLTYADDSAAALADFEGYEPREVTSEPPLACYVRSNRLPCKLQSR